jgi:hypothetical protein
MWHVLEEIPLKTAAQRGRLDYRFRYSNNQAGVPGGHQTRCRVSGDPKGLRPSAHELIPRSDWLLPERLLPDGVDKALVASPNGTGENVEPALILANAVEKLFHECRI